MFYRCYNNYSIRIRCKITSLKKSLNFFHRSLGLDDLDGEHKNKMIANNVRIIVTAREMSLRIDCILKYVAKVFDKL